MSKLALVTGASSGLGKALCKQLAQEKIELILIARNRDRLQEIALELPTLTQIYTIDLANPKDREKLLSLIHLTQPDLVINNAGLGLYGPVLAHSLDVMNEMVQVNVQALMEITIETARAFAKNKKQGTIVNISSAAGFFSYPTFSVYAATKAFVNSFSKAMDSELKLRGIRILTVCPGQIDTDFRARASQFHPQKKDRWTMQPQTAAHLILKQIKAGKSVSIIDWRYRCLIGIAKLFPTCLLHPFFKRSLQKRHSFKELD